MVAQIQNPWLKTVDPPESRPPEKSRHPESRNGGSRHKKKLPVRGQRTQCNARTRKGKAVAIAGKKKVTKG